MVPYQLIVATLLLCSTSHAIQVKPGSVYGPPLPSSSLSSINQIHRVPHREYGVPQKIPYREYGPPAIKYGPPKFIGNFGVNSIGASTGLHEQIKTHFGLPKPFYGPPVSYKPSKSYGPPLRHPSPQYGLPVIKVQHKPSAQYGPPKFHHHSTSPQPLPLIQPAALFKPEHQPSSSYGPPPSGPISDGPKQSYGPPPSNVYGPPQFSGFNKGPEATLIVTAAHTANNYQQQQQQHHHHQSAQQLHIQIDSNGHTQGASGPQTPFHTACKGWIPIPGPSGNTYLDNNNIDTQSGEYNHQTQNGHVGHVETLRVEGGGSDGGLSNEQLVAVALQSGAFDGNDNAIHSHAQIPPHPGPTAQFNQHQLFNKENDLHLSLGNIEDTYSKPPRDSYAPGSVHDFKHQREPQRLPLPPQAPNTHYGLPLSPALGSGNFLHHQTAQHGLGIQYGKQSGNLQSLPLPPGLPPNKPVVFRPPVPQGLLETIGATVKHVDAFGRKPQAQAPAYIPPAANEIALSSSSNLNQQYGPPLNIIEQQLPQDASPAPNFVHVAQQQPHSEYAAPDQFELQKNYLPPSGPDQSANEYLPPLVPTNDQQNGIKYTAEAIATFENAYSASESNHKTVSGQQQASGYQNNDCGYGPNLISTAPGGLSGDSVSQSIPIAEHHSQYYTNPTNSYGPPPSGGIDNLGFASENSGLSALAHDNHPNFNSPNANSGQGDSSYQLEISSSGKQSVNHAEIISNDLLQTILTTIEQQPQLQSQTLQYLGSLPVNHKAENRLDLEHDQTTNEVVNHHQHHQRSSALLDNEIANSESVATVVEPSRDAKSDESKLLKTIIVNDDNDNDNDNDNNNGGNDNIEKIQDTDAETTKH